MLQDSPSPSSHKAAAAFWPLTSTTTTKAIPTTTPSSPTHPTNPPMSPRPTATSSHLEDFESWGSSPYNADPRAYPGVEENMVSLLQQLPRERADALYKSILEKQRGERKAREEAVRFANGSFRESRAKGGVQWYGAQ
ncbi:hypothetical protein DFH27DRAFT_524327 [Peziza echinospora]|nr:hypothetical protein DFH27DRAFT_524327 [Peziza echinospora]